MEVKLSFEYDREAFLTRTEISERLLKEIITAFEDSPFNVSEDEITDLLTQGEDNHLIFNIIHILENYTDRYTRDHYYELSVRVKDIIGNFCYDYRSYSFNYHDFPR